jgi:hypothetical protein
MAEIRGDSKGTTKAKATLQLRCPSPDVARVLWEAVGADDPGTIEGSIDGVMLTITAGPDRIASLRVTLDDTLACLQVASGAVGTTRPGQEVD